MLLKNLYILFIFICFMLAGCSNSSTPKSSENTNHTHPNINPIFFRNLSSSPLTGENCSNGFAQTYACENVDFIGGLKFNTQASDIWGWTDPSDNQDYAILGLTSGTAFIRITTPETPKLIGFLPSVTNTSNWRDIKVTGHYALIVSEAYGYGMQVFDLTRLSSLEQLTELSEDAHYHQFSGAHNIAVNEDTGFAYVVGSNTCSGGLHMIDISDPLSPKSAGCYSGDGYTHDTQCVTYNGPDTDYLGHELCFSANEDTLSVTDVSNKSAPKNIFSKPYVGAAYSHQGWLSEDHRYFLLGDELDEIADDASTRTYIWDIRDLDNPKQNFTYIGQTKAIDHNMYVKGDHVFQANYQAGIRILRTGNLSLGEMDQVAFFDTTPEINNQVEFTGTWSVYPYFSSGLIITANVSGEFFVLKPNLDNVPRCSDGLDNDGDGASDYPADAECVDADTVSESAL